MIEGKSPAQLAGGKNGQPFRVLDMACGSGSFLLGAYQCLLDHCLKWYIEHQPEKHKKAVYTRSPRREWRLTIAEKKRILTTHIFGVDIDAQAVEVSKLSLLLKVLEGETDQTVGKSTAAFPRTGLAQSRRQHQVRQLPDRPRLFHRPADSRSRRNEARQSLRLEPRR